MYKLLLILRYLRRKLAPMFAVLAVTLCTAMLIIVISVMGGFLQMMRDAAQKLTGEVMVGADLSGFPYYQELIDELQRLPQVHAATALVRSYGLVNLNNRVLTVEVHGVDAAGLDAVTGYGGTLHWTSRDLLELLEAQLPPAEELTPGEKERIEARRRFYEQLDLRRLGMTFTPPPEWSDRPNTPGIVLGIEVSPWSVRDSQGQYSALNSSLGMQVTMTVLPLTRRGTFLDPAVRRMAVVNEFKSGLYDIDAHRVYVSFELLQKMLRMDAAEQVDPETGKPTGKVDPARATEVLVRGVPGVPLEELRRQVSSVTQQFAGDHLDCPPLWVQTWLERHAMLLGAVEREKLLLTFLFAIISVVAVVMIAVIFYMIVLEKTRDIGVLRALGASRFGIESIFLGYGLAIGVIGAGLGVGIAAVVVSHINEIQDFLTEHYHFTMWDPKIYYFDRIPTRFSPMEVSVIAAAAVLSGLLGSLLPAYLAGRLNPVEALRYE